MIDHTLVPSYNSELAYFTIVDFMWNISQIQTNTGGYLT